MISNCIFVKIYDIDYLHFTFNANMVHNIRKSPAHMLFLFETYSAYYCASQ